MSKLLRQVKTLSYPQSLLLSIIVAVVALLGIGSQTSKQNVIPFAQADTPHTDDDVARDGGEL